MNANAKIIKVVPRWGPKGETLVEVTLQWGSHRPNPKLTVPIPEDGIYRKGERVIYSSTQRSIVRPEPPAQEKLISA